MKNKKGFSLKVVKTALVTTMMFFAMATQAKTTYMACYFSDTEGFNVTANDESGNTSLVFFKDGGSYSGQGVFTSESLILNYNVIGPAANGTINAEINRETLKFKLRQRIFPTSEGMSFGLRPLNTSEDGTCYIDKAPSNRKF